MKAARGIPWEATVIMRELQEDSNDFLRKSQKKLRLNFRK